MRLGCVRPYLRSSRTGRQTITDQSAEGVARAVLTALEEKRWADASALADPADLARFCEHHLELARTFEETPGLTAQDLRALRPELPSEVAEWFAGEQARDRERLGPHVAREFAGVRSLAELKALAPAEMFARWLQAQDPDYQMERQLNAAGQGTAAPPVRVTRQVIGHITEQDGLVHVLYRTAWPGSAADSPSELAVITVRRLGNGSWRLAVNPSFHVP